MKAILVIDMPLNCRGCDKLVRKGCLKGDYRKDERPKQCPLKPIPKCHGRLIDADEAIQVLKSLGNRDYRREKGTIQDAIKMLSYDEYTPTIIEADKRGE